MSIAALRLYCHLVSITDLIESVVPSGDHCCTEIVLPSSDHYCIESAAPSGNHSCTETVLPSSDHYCIESVSPSGDYCCTEIILPSSDHHSTGQHGHLVVTWPPGYATVQQQVAFSVSRLRSGSPPMTQPSLHVFRHSSTSRFLLLCAPF